jgi:hypothetical protein
MTGKIGKITVRYFNRGEISEIDGAAFYALTMASEEQRRAKVEELYPEYTWDPDQGPLANWRDAAADENGVSRGLHGDVAQAIRSELFLPEGLGTWIWFLA